MEAQTATQAQSPQAIAIHLDPALNQSLEAVIGATTINDQTEKDSARSEIDLLIAKVMSGQIQLNGRVERSLRSYIDQLDKLISQQVSEVMHDSKFQRLESTWRGLQYLVRNTQIIKDIKLRVLNATRDELHEDLLNAKAFDKSRYYKKLVEEVYESAGGEPYSAVIGDFDFDSSNKDIEFLKEMAKVSALAHAPFIASASAKMFDLNDFTELPDKHVDLGVQFAKPKYINWNQFREMEESRYIGLVAPRFLVREPYSESNYKASFAFKEEVDGRDHSKYLWSNAAFAFGARLTEAFFNYGWTTAIIGEESGGRVENLPLHYFDTETGTQAIKCPTETKVSDPRWAEMADQGFIPLVHKENTNFATFYTAPSCQRPQVYDKSSANANARLSASLPYIFAASRFAHYLKVINRTKLGSFATRKTLEDYLNRWILNYVVGNEDASQELKSAFPLQEARVDVETVPGKPGWYRAVAFLKPHMHLEAVTTSLRLVADLPQKKQ